MNKFGEGNGSCKEGKKINHLWSLRYKSTSPNILNPPHTFSYIYVGLQGNKACGLPDRVESSWPAFEYSKVSYFCLNRFKVKIDLFIPVKFSSWPSLTGLPVFQCGRIELGFNFRSNWLYRSVRSDFSNYDINCLEERLNILRVSTFTPSKS